MTEREPQMSLAEFTKYLCETVQQVPVPFNDLALVRYYMEHHEPASLTDEAIKRLSKLPEVQRAYWRYLWQGIMRSLSQHWRAVVVRLVIAFLVMETLALIFHW